MSFLVDVGLRGVIDGDLHTQHRERMIDMKTPRIAVQITSIAAIVAMGVGLAIAAPPAKPGPKRAIAQLPRRLAAADIKLSKAAVLANIERATGPAASECPGAKAALQAYESCKANCATAAENAPITPAELERCGDQSAADCAELLIASRARACINAPPPAGCRDEWAKLQQENAECKSCNDLMDATDKAVDAMKAQARVVAQAEAALAHARAHLEVAAARARALSAKAQRACAAAQK